MDMMGLLVSLISDRRRQRGWLLGKVASGGVGGAALLAVVSALKSAMAK